MTPKKSPKINNERKINPLCEHIDYDNNHDCCEEAEFVCMCCGVYCCREHKKRNCQYGGMSYLEI